MALSLIGNKTITSIETPESTEEKICSLWYDTVLKEALIEACPNFAEDRMELPLSNKVNNFGFKFAFQKPAEVLKVLGIGEVYETYIDYKVEGKYIYTDYNLNNSLPIRYIKYIEDSNEYSPEFIDYFVHCLAHKICYQINKDQSVKQSLKIDRNEALLNSHTTDNQESKIMIVSTSKYIQSRFGIPYNRLQK